MKNQDSILRTSQWVCMARAISYLENNKHLKCNDYLSSVFIPDVNKVKKVFESMIENNLIPKGGYEYVISRTKYIDDIFNNLDKETSQVVIIGSGLDTRSIRYKNILKNTKVYELDFEITQTVKVNRLKEMKVDIPKNIKHVNINFINENLNKIENYGFEKNKKNLYIMEGILMYLNVDSVNKIFRYIKENSYNESIIVFDYVTNDFFNNNDMNELITKSGEKCNFTIENDYLKEYLHKYSLEVLDISDNNKLENKYFTDDKGNKKSFIFGYHGNIVTSKKYK